MLVQAGGAREEGRVETDAREVAGGGAPLLPGTSRGARLLSASLMPALPAEATSRLSSQKPGRVPLPWRPRRTGKSSAGTFLVVRRGFSVSSAGPRTPQGSKPLALPATGGSSWVFWLSTGPRESHAVKGAARRELRAEGGRGRRLGG